MGCGLERPGSKEAGGPAAARRALLIRSVFLSSLLWILFFWGAEGVLGAAQMVSEVDLTLPNDRGLYNAVKAAEYINQTVVMPGEEFSFNAVVGPRTAERGFRTGGVISFVNGKHRIVQEIGGGVCRASTALFQAVRQAGLRVTERHGHSIRIAYARPGEDASVQWGVWDLRFVNDRLKPILIEMTSEKNVVHARIYELAGQRTTQVFIDGALREYSRPPVLEGNDVLAPLRETLEPLGLTVGWDRDKNLAAVTGSGLAVEFKPESSTVRVNGRVYYLDQGVRLVNGTLMVPLFFLAEQCGFEARVVISSPPAA